jgi:hypothetical protein
VCRIRDVRIAKRTGTGATGAVRTFSVAERPTSWSAAAVKVTQNGERRVYTRRLRTVQVAAALLVATVLAIGPTDEFVIGNHALAAVIAGAVFVAGLLFCGALLRRAIVVTPGLLTVRGLVTTRRIPVLDVARFEPPAPYGKVFGRVALRIVMKDGRVRTVGVFANTRLDGNAAGAAECRELNQWLARQGGRADGEFAPLPDRRHDSRATTAGWFSWLVLLTSFAVFCPLVVLSAVVDPTFGV